MKQASSNTDQKCCPNVSKSHKQRKYGQFTASARPPRLPLRDETSLLSGERSRLFAARSPRTRLTKSKSAPARLAENKLTRSRSGHQGSLLFQTIVVTAA